MLECDVVVAAGDGEDCFGDKLVLMVRWPAVEDDGGSRLKIDETGADADVDDRLSSAL